MLATSHVPKWQSQHWEGKQTDSSRIVTRRESHARHEKSRRMCAKRVKANRSPTRKALFSLRPQHHLELSNADCPQLTDSVLVESSVRLSRSSPLTEADWDWQATSASNYCSPASRGWQQTCFSLEWFSGEGQAEEQLLKNLFFKVKKQEARVSEVFTWAENVKAGGWKWSKSTQNICCTDYFSKGILG